MGKTLWNSEYKWEKEDANSIQSRVGGVYLQKN